MKKITGKVVSLVLALALVVTSFSANFAFASTKTISGTVSHTDNDDEIYLVSGGTNKTVDDLLSYTGAELKTKAHDEVTGVKISAISHVSGDKLVSLSLTGTDDDDAVLKLKKSDAEGKEIINVLYEGDWTDDDTGDEYTVKASKELTVYAFAKDAIVFGKLGTVGTNSDLVDDTSDYSTKDSGVGLDDVDAFAQTRNFHENIGIFQAEPYEVSTSNVALNSARAMFKVATGLTSSTATSGFANAGFTVAVTSGSDNVHLNVPGTTTNTGTGDVTATVGKGTYTHSLYGTDASVGNVVVTVKKLIADGNTFKVSSDSDDKYTLKTKVEKKVDVDTVIDNGDLSDVNSYIVEKADSTTKLSDGTHSVKVADTNVVFDNTDATIDVQDNTNLKKISGSVKKISVGDANVDSIDLDNGSVEVTDGSVGDITTDGTIDGSVTVTGGKVGDIKTTDVDLIAPSDGDVTIEGGSTGTIESDGLVTLTASDDDDAITTGKITATTFEAFADESKINIAGVKANDDGDSDAFTLKGSNLSIGSIDLDYYKTSVKFGDDSDEFVGKVVAPINAVNGTIATENEDTVVTMTGAVNVDTLSLDSDTNISFDNTVTADTIDGDGTMKIAAGKLYVGSSASGVTLKLSDAVLAVGAVAFKSGNDSVDVDDLNTFGFEVTKSEGTSVDTFKIASLNFGGVAINKATSNIAKGYSETFTASAYPGGTSLPTGYTVTWDLDGGSSDVFTLTTTGNTATVKVNSLDASFSSENKTTLTATLYDEDGYEDDDYDAATCAITATATPDATSDTNSALSVAKGASYTMKVTSTTAPSVTTGSAGVFSVALVSKTGNDYLYKLTATGTVGAATGVYLNGNKIFVATVKAFAFTSDTTGTATVKGAYQFKITSATTPTVGLGTAGVFKLAFVSKTGNDYLYKITSAGAAGSKTGVYVNGAKAFVAVVG
jgi:hypothetical protein